MCRPVPDPRLKILPEKDVLPVQGPPSGRRPRSSYTRLPSPTSTSIGEQKGSVTSV